MNQRLAVVTATGLALTSLAAPSAAGAKREPDPTETARPQPAEHDMVDKSIAFYAGKNRTTDGHTLIGGFGHEPSSHWVEIVPRQQHPEDATIFPPR